MSEKQIKLSPNSLNLFLECPHCFWLEKNKGIKRPPPYPYALNSAVDDLLKQEFDTYRANNLPHPMFKENHIKAHLFPNQKLLNQWRNNLAGIRYFDEDLKATLFGAMDDVLEFDDDKLAPLDYKSTGSPTSKIYDRFQLQLDVYAFLMEKNGFKVKKKGYLVFYVVDRSRGFIDRLPFRKEILEVETSPSDVYDIFKDAVDVLRLELPPEHSEDCTFSKFLRGAKQFL
jgi:CRISPR/Cas system-associated exonuclease Cas4 (RecB family)